MTEQPEYEVIRIGKEYRPVIDELCAQNDLNTKKKLVEEMLIYFKDTGINPTDRIVSTSNELKKLTNIVKKQKDTYISFIREQERTRLNPLVDGVNEFMGYMRKVFEEDFIRRQDIKELTNSFLNVKTLADSPKSESLPSTAPKENAKLPNTIDEDSERKVRRAKTIFDDFIGEFKQSTFNKGTSTVDSRVIKKYQDLFSRL